MCDIVELYEIIPINSGLHYVCYDKQTDNYYNEHKGNTVKEALVFNTEKAAIDYINKYLNPELYSVEKFGYSISKAPFIIRTAENLGN